MTEFIFTDHESTKEDFHTVLEIADAVKLPVSGPLRRFVGHLWSDEGKKQKVFFSSTLYVDKAGLMCWTEARVIS